ncbi:MAG: oligosaccharide flippase family protein [Bacteroidales bacterium]|nr:oligosaccharide flippase family protein [Bacteroidales bacterium]
MGIIARQSIKGAVANYIGVAIGFFTTFFVLTDCLTQEEIGLTRVMVDAAMLLSGLAQLGTNSSIIRFFPYFSDEQGKGNHGMFGLTLLIPFIGFAIVAAVFLLCHDGISAAYSQQSPMIVDYLYLLLPLTFFALYLTVFETNASVLMRITVPKIVREVGIRLFNLVCYLLYGHGVISLDTFVVLFCASYGIAMLLNLFYLLSLGKVSLRIDFRGIDRRVWRDLLFYTLMMTVTALAANVQLVNSLLLGAKTGLALTGVYTIAFYIANIVEVPYRSLGAIARPKVATAVKEGDWKEVNRLTQQVSLHQLLVSLMIFYIIWINLSALFRVIPHGDEYVGGMQVVFILGLSKVVYSSFSIALDTLNFSRYYAYSLLFNMMLTTAAIVFNIKLIPLLGINGAALATLLSYLLFYSLLLAFVGWRLRVSLFSLKQLFVVALMAVLFLLNGLWSSCVEPSFGSGLVPMLANATLKTLLLVAIGIVAVYKSNISPDINRILRFKKE